MIGDLLDKIPMAIRIVVCVPSLVLAFLVAVFWIGTLAGMIGASPSLVTRGNVHDSRLEEE